MKEFNPYSPPSSAVSNIIKPQRVGFLIETCIAFMASALMLSMLWLPAQAIKLSGWGGSKVVPFPFFDTQLLYLLAMGEVVGKYFFIMFLLFSLAAVASRFIQSYKKKKLLLVICLTIYAVVVLVFIFTPQHHNYFSSIRFFLPLYCLVIAPSALVARAIQYSNSAVTYLTNNTGLVLSLFSLGLVLFEISMWVLWQTDNLNL